MNKNINKDNEVFTHTIINSSGKTSKICDACSKPLYYSHKYDAMYCPNCNVWTEEKCDEPNCEYCIDRPEKPEVKV